jgi:hypothetical protein
MRSQATIAGVFMAASVALAGTAEAQKCDIALEIQNIKDGIGSFAGDKYREARDIDYKIGEIKELAGLFKRMRTLPDTTKTKIGTVVQPIEEGLRIIEEANKVFLAELAGAVIEGCGRCRQAVTWKYFDLAEDNEGNSLGSITEDTLKKLATADAAGRKPFPLPAGSGKQGIDWVKAGKIEDAQASLKGVTGRSTDQSKAYLQVSLFEALLIPKWGSDEWPKWKAAYDKQSAEGAKFRKTMEAAHDPGCDPTRG